MKKEKKVGNVNPKIILVAIAVLIVVIVIVAIAVNAGKGKENNKGAEGNGGENQNEQVSGPAIEGDENIKQDGNVKTNVSKALKEDKKYGIYTLSNIKVESVNGLAKLTATVSANVSEKVAGKPVKVEFYDKDGKMLSSMGAYMPQVKPGETRTFEAKSTTDFANIYDFKIVDAD